MSQKLTLKDDIVFKAFFSRNENYLKSFLSAILGKEIKIFPTKQISAQMLL